MTTPPKERIAEIRATVDGFYASDAKAALRDLLTAIDSERAARERAEAHARVMTDERKRLVDAGLELSGELAAANGVADEQRERATRAERAVETMAGELATAFDRGRTAGRSDVGKYANAIGRIEGALGIVGAQPLDKTVMAVETAIARAESAEREVLKSRVHCQKGVCDYPDATCACPCTGCDGDMAQALFFITKLEHDLAEETAETVRRLNEERARCDALVAELKALRGEQ